MTHCNIMYQFWQWFHCITNPMLITSLGILNIIITAKDQPSVKTYDIWWSLFACGFEQLCLRMHVTSLTAQSNRYESGTVPNITALHSGRSMQSVIHSSTETTSRTSSLFSPSMSSPIQSASYFACNRLLTGGIKRGYTNNHFPYLSQICSADWLLSGCVSPHCFQTSLSRFSIVLMQPCLEYGYACSCCCERCTVWKEFHSQICNLLSRVALSS